MIDDGKRKAVNQLKKTGRAICLQDHADRFGTSGPVTFWGQADQRVTMSLDEICRMPS
jgi:hypothetical protein